MKPTIFYIALNLRTATGYETFGKFFIGNNREIASIIFRKLQGQKDVNEKTVLSLELMETKNGLPQNVQMLSCCLDDLAENIKTITREIFKLHNLEQLR
jgi:hypothetical protein